MLICCQCAENGYANELGGNELVEGFSLTILNQEIPQDLKLPQRSSNSSNSIKNSHFAAKLPFQNTPDYSGSIAFTHPRTLQ